MTSILKRPTVDISTLQTVQSVLCEHTLYPKYYQSINSWVQKNRCDFATPQPLASTRKVSQESLKLDLLFLLFFFFFLTAFKSSR